jgi:hypothetical protein
MCLLVAAGVVLPVALAIGAYVLSSGFGASATVVDLPTTAPRAPQEGGQTTRVQPTGGSDGESDASPSASSDQCAEPEHRSDPTCLSGSGSGDTGGSSGSGSTESGSGGGSGSSDSTSGGSGSSDGSGTSGSSGSSDSTSSGSYGGSGDDHDD